MDTSDQPNANEPPTNRFQYFIFFFLIAKRALEQSDGEPDGKRNKIFKVSALCAAIGRRYHLDTADVNFVFDVDGNDEVVPVHKSMLALHSPVFRQMFYGELKEKGDIKLPDTTIGAFVDLMQCFYSLGLPIEGSQSKISDLVYLAHKYDVNWLEQECNRILSVIVDYNVDAALWILPLATLYSYDELRQKCIQNIRSHGNSLIQSAEFVECEREVVKEILGIDFVDRNEVEVFEMCIDWAKRACRKDGLDSELPENVREQLGDCFDLIRFVSMTQEQFLQCLIINSEVFTHGEIQQFASKLCTAKPNKEQRKYDTNLETPGLIIKVPSDTVQSWLGPLFEDQSTAYVTFVFKNEQNEETERISAHKFMLASDSEFFADQFESTNNSNDEIVITGVSAEVFKYFIRTIYAFHIYQFNAILDEVGDQHDAMLTLYKKYLIYYLKDYTEYLTETLNEQNVISRFELSRKHSLDELETKCVEFMEENGENSIASGALMECSQQNLQAILELRIWDGEKSLAAACIKWAEKYCEGNQLDPEDPNHLRTAMGDFFALIPFSAMDPLEFIDFQSKYRGMLTGDEIAKVINEFADRRNAELA